ncbi:class I SAM-dependent methyltransferase [Actinoplanes sp. NPDC051494]|uniref:class I SAM-dependent methyltransferase n=1 Tax=Actinoplanes sp. NPDC051494 TaxID=3363907 RepID=UPI00378BB85A
MGRDEALSTLTEMDALRDFYCSGDRSLFDVWEDGGARGDSVTPSTSSPEYRAWMRDRVLAAGGGAVLSLGCGNAAVERELMGAGLRVLAVDALQEAVDVARAKGVDAVRADIMTWAPAGSWPVVYSDGLFGHLYAYHGDLSFVFDRIRSWLVPGGTLIVSNDAPRDGGPVQQAPGVPGFRWLSGEYLRDQALAVGFRDAVVESYRYERPLSGPRTRAVLTVTA